MRPMPRALPVRPGALPRDLAALRQMADQAFSRAAGAPLVGGNDVRILRDAAENYPAWEAAIERARSTIHLEMYIIHRDRVGRRFVDLLARRAREGVTVRVVYDWWGCGTGPLLGLFRPLTKAGGEARPFNPPTVTTVLGWVRRDHRKLLVVDGRVAYVSGLCIGRMWEGDPRGGRAPWRDTGVEIRGPAVSHAEAAFADSWQLTGGRMPHPGGPTVEHPEEAGTVNLRLIPTEPFTARLLRVDLLAAAMARRTLWITDAYFIDHGPYLEALRRAARDGVDVRLLLPQGSDIGWTVPASRTLYRTLLEAGVRIFEWSGPMVHAKTAVADGRWARIGSSNLNVTSWFGNWELDVAIEDADVAGMLAEHYAEDLAQATEIVLTEKRRPKQVRPVPPKVRARRAVRAVSGVGSSLGAVVTGSRRLEDFEVVPLVGAGVLLIALATLGFLRPVLLAWPLAFLTVWTGLSFLGEAVKLWRARRRR